MEIKLPPGWTESTGKTTLGVLAWYDSGTKMITYYPRWWLWPVWWLMVRFIRRHERAHAWGIKDCLSSSNDCIMYEDNDTLRGKLELLPGQISGGLSFCPECLKFLENQNG